MLNTLYPRWRSNAAGGPIQSLRAQVGLRPKLRCAPQKVLKSLSFLTENILKREKPNAGENSLIKLPKVHDQRDPMTAKIGYKSSRLYACTSSLS